MIGGAVAAVRRTALEWAQGLDRGLMALRRWMLPSSLVLFEDLKGRWLVSVLGVAGELELAERIPDRGTVELGELAQRCRAPAEELSRLLRVLDDHRYLCFDGARVSRTRLTRALSLGCGGGFAAMLGSHWYGDCFSVEAVLQGWGAGRVSFEERTGVPFFQSLASEPSRGRRFQEAMAEITRFCAPYLAASLPLEPGETILDIGGGDGTLARALMSRYGAQVEVLDLHPDSPHHEKDEGAASPPELALRYHQASFFETLPGAYSRYVLKNVLHDWDDTRCLEILRNIHRAAATDSRLEIFEAVLPSRGERRLPGGAHTLLDWNVAHTLGGRERTEVELRELLGQAGWELRESLPTGTPLRRLTAVLELGQSSVRTQAR